MSAVDVVSRLYQGFADDDVAALVDILDAGVEWIEAEGYIYGGTYYGPEAVLQVLARDRSEWNGFTAEPEMMISEGDQVVTRGWYSGVYKTTNKSLKARFVHWYTVRGDKIVRFEQVVDSAKVFEAL